LIGKLNSFTFRVIIERSLLIPVLLLLFLQIESCVNYSLLLVLFDFGFCWFSEFIMVAVFVGLSIPLEGKVFVSPLRLKDSFAV
jgi:hypothetical protein